MVRDFEKGLGQIRTMAFRRFFEQCIVLNILLSIKLAQFSRWMDVRAIVQYWMIRELANYFKN